ncbi:hypothetical protein HDU67_001515 [Dinochytrium kinnereticum]|nr:hypothetical protein HDU67_001515 [Dinochytrium kinnereticum]
MDSLTRLAEVLEEVTQFPKSKSVLVIGERGSGKSHIINDDKHVKKIMTELRTRTNPRTFHEIWLRGLYHADPRIAFKDMALQLQLNFCEDDLQTVRNKMADWFHSLV